MTAMFWIVSIVIASKMHSSAHFPHPSHFSASTCTIIGDFSTLSCAKRESAFEAAPEAWATVSGISFGPRHVPARKNPEFTDSTGLNFGCASERKPEVPTEKIKFAC